MTRHNITFAAVVLAAVGLALAALLLRSGEAAVAATVAGAEAARRAGALRRGSRRDAKAEAKAAAVRQAEADTTARNLVDDLRAAKEAKAIADRDERRKRRQEQADAITARRKMR